MIRVLLACLALLICRPAYAYLPPSVVARVGTVAPKYVPVCNALTMPGAATLSSGTQPFVNSRTVLTCPRGASQLRFILTGAWLGVNGVETDLTDPVPQNLGLEYPLGTLPATPVTCAGVQPCYLGTLATAAGGTATTGILLTDPVAVSIPAGGQAAIRTYVFQTSGQKATLGPPIGSAGFAIGDVGNFFTSTTDLSSTGTEKAYAGNVGGPAAVIGIPLTYGPTVCIADSDSRAAGVTGGAGLVNGTVSAGGTGFVSGDVGRTFTIPGGSTSGVGLAATGVITTVSSGAVTRIDIISTGAYSTTNTGQTLPTSPQAITVAGSAGTGLSVGFTTTGTSTDDGDAVDNQGFIARGLYLAGIPYIKMSRAGSTLASWVTRSQSELALIAASGCSSAINENGINDVNAGTSAATIEADMTIVANQERALGVTPYWTTMMPHTTSTNGYANAGFQTPYSTEAVRVQVNTDLRAGTIPGIGSNVIDATEPLEVNGSNVLTANGGRWLANGSVGGYTIDGLHPMIAGHILAAGVISSSAAVLQ
jgi:hypothetical protein